MDVDRTLRLVADAFERSQVSCALIGGLALAFRGVQRATVDVDFVLLAEHRSVAAEVLCGIGFREGHLTEEVSHFVPDNPALCRVDLLHARRAPSRAMLTRAEAVFMEGGQILHIVRSEDLIGLKLQAIRNDPRRALQDWADICALLSASEKRGLPVDRDAVRQYLELFSFGDKFSSLFTEPS